MKTNVNFKGRASGLTMLLLLVGAFLFTQCDKESVVTPLTGTDVTGQYAVNTTDGSWRFDKAHSNFGWQTAYVGDQAWLTGRFNNFGTEINFDQNDLSASSIIGWVKLSSFNTGEPGRDGLGKCGPRYMGIEHNGDTLADGSLDPAGIDGNTDTARFVSSEIVAYGDGYKATGDFSFRGVTRTVNLIFTYITEKDYSSAQDGSNIRASFSGQFELDASDEGHAVGSTSIADVVDVLLNAQFRKN